MLLVISLEGRDDKGEKVENRAFYISDNFSVCCPFFLRISLQKSLEDKWDRKYVLPWIYLKDEMYR